MTVLCAGQVHWILWYLNVRCKFALLLCIFLLVPSVGYDI